jgi:tripartite-type tricarboxylate transporter receptor subunit TctC
MANTCKWILGIAAFAMTGTALAQAWPARPVRVIVPWPPGGGTDIVIRPLTQRLSENLGQQFLVDSRGGANGLIGTELAAKAPGDGYTFMFTTLAAFAQNTSYYRKLPYDPERDFTPVTQVGWTPLVMAAHPSLPAKTARDVVALAKSRPGELVYGSFGSGSTSHFAGALLALETKTTMIHVSYKGGGPVLVANVSGEVPIHYGGVPPTLPHVKAGKLRALAVTGSRRSAHMPDVPTMAEALKLSDYDVTVTFGMLAPAATPREIIDRIHAEIGRVVQSPDFKSRLAALGYDETPLLTPAQTGDWLRKETAHWKRLVELTGIRAE